MIRPYILKESNWKTLKTHRFELAVLPWGATEAHNYHLPYGTDIYEADEIGAEAGRKAWEKGGNVSILPTIPFGVNTGQTDIYMDINMNPSTQFLILRDIIEVLDRQGINKFLILNSHGGNDFKTSLRELGLQFPKMSLFTCNWFQAIEKSQFFEHDGDHAEEMETSLIHHLFPNLVLPLKEAGIGAEKKSKISGVREKWAWSERKWSQVSEDTGIGNPKKASALKGSKYFSAVTDKVADLMLEICKSDPLDLYE